MTDSGESKLPLQYEDGPDYCTVRDAQGRDFALTVQPELMKAMESVMQQFEYELASRRAKAAAEKVIEDAKIDPSSLQKPITI